TGASIHGLYVIDTRDYSTLPESNWIGLMEEELEAEGERALESVRRRAERADVDVSTSLERGVPHKKIVEYVDDHDIDLVVMGTHGRTGLDRFLIGSVTEKVLRSADVPLLIVRIKPAPDASE
ncbi:MAG: universal stress protein, partial [Halodesulfurarchaeum sp.]